MYLPLDVLIALSFDQAPLDLLTYVKLTRAEAT